MNEMKSKTNGTMQRAQVMGRVKGDGPNWILIAGGALLSTLLIRIGCKLKHVLETKGLNKDIRGNRNTAKPRLGHCQLHSNLYQFTPDKEDFYTFISVRLNSKSKPTGKQANKEEKNKHLGFILGFLHTANPKVTNLPITRPLSLRSTVRHSERAGHANGGMQIKQAFDNPISKESELSLPLVTISAADLNKDSNGSTMWSSSSELLELPHKPSHHSTGSDSPSISESGSDIYTRREAINKLRQQLKRRDEMIMDMQNQIAELQNSLCTQMSLAARTQSQLDAANQELFESEREIQRLRKAIANHCILKSNSPEKLASVGNWQPVIVNGFPDSVKEKVNGAEETMGLLKKELCDLRAVIEGKDLLLHSYKEQKHGRT